MRVGIEARFIEFGPSGGIAPLLHQTLSTLARRHPEHRFFVYGTIFNRSLVDPEAANVTVEALPLDLASTWPSLDSHLARDDVDVLFRSYPVLDSLRFPPGRQVVLIPDMQHDHFPEFFAAATLKQRQEAFALVLGSAGAIGTISEYARKTILDSPQNRCRDVFLMQPALKPHDAAGAATPTLADRLAGIGSYFLFPANLWPHKNHERLLRAFETYRRTTGRNDAMVFTGHPEGWERLASDFGHLPVHHLGFVGDNDLRLLYRHALALTFFSLYEGFGMPLLEAFDAGCPVICSDTTSLPEVGGDAVLSCDPCDIGAMARLMERVATDEALRASLAARGRGRLGRYRWEHSADELMAALARVGGASAQGRMLDRPLVSIVTPSFNQGRFLRRTIDSVLNQTYGNIEYLVVDGGSTDDSKAILESYGDRLRWVSEPDGGQTNAINKGFARARGEIRAYLNSDDTLLPDAVEQAVAFFRRNPDCDLVYGEGIYIDEHDRIVGTYDTAEYSFERLMWDCCVCQPAAFWRRGVADRIGPFDERLHYAMDYDYWLRIGRAGGRIVHMRRPLANSRVHRDTKTQSRRAEIFAEIFDVCFRHGGYVSHNYFLGLWHERLERVRRRAPFTVERGDPGPVVKLFARAHSRWFHGYRRFKTSLARIAGAAGRSSGSGRKRIQPPNGKRVAGFWPDAWLAPEARISKPDFGQAALLHLSGRAARDCELVISANGSVLKTATLGGNREVRIEFPPPREAPIHLRFTSSMIDPAGRELAFRVSSTNMFAERDL
ncbi:MAG: glycosyltransferase [Alphaproteobacteria bacterium]